MMSRNGIMFKSPIHHKVTIEIHILLWEGGNLNSTYKGLNYKRVIFNH